MATPDSAVHGRAALGLSTPTGETDPSVRDNVPAMRWSMVEQLEAARRGAVQTARVNTNLSRAAAEQRRKLARTYRSGDGGIGVHDNAVLDALEDALRDEAVALIELADAIRDAHD